ncbi:hypothetical protein IWQ61_002755 [Dispira simplex]|nr:hypothetical protein IWQ61_002755 [Dispira simplex]
MSRMTSLIQLWRSLRLPWRSTVQVGKDHFGNVYFEKHEKGRIYPRRWVKLTTDSDHYSAYDTDKVPVQWQSWLRHTRFDAPTEEEIGKADAFRILVQERAQAIDADWKKAKVIKDPSTSAPKLKQSGEKSQVPTATDLADKETVNRGKMAEKSEGTHREPLNEKEVSADIQSEFQPEAWDAKPRR